MIYEANDLVLQMAERVRARDKRVSILRDELARTRRFALALAERVAAQSELLFRRAEKTRKGNE